MSLPSSHHLWNLTNKNHFHILQFQLYLYILHESQLYSFLNFLMYKYTQTIDNYKQQFYHYLLKIQMGHMSYNRVGRKYYGTRGFRLTPKRLYVQRLRAKFFNFFKILMGSWRSSSSSSSYKSSTKGLGKLSQRSLVAKENAYRLRSFGRSNSFYSEAIEDCLEFIKRSSVSLEDKPQL